MKAWFSSSRVTGVGEKGRIVVEAALSGHIRLLNFNRKSPHSSGPLLTRAEKCSDRCLLGFQIAGSAFGLTERTLDRHSLHGATN